jgi:hypothetical protein
MTRYSSAREVTQGTLDACVNCTRSPAAVTYSMRAASSEANGRLHAWKPILTSASFKHDAVGWRRKSDRFTRVHSGRTPGTLVT